MYSNAIYVLTCYLYTNVLYMYSRAIYILTCYLCSHVRSMYSNAIYILTCVLCISQTAHMVDIVITTYHVILRMAAVYRPTCVYHVMTDSTLLMTYV